MHNVPRPLPPEDVALLGEYLATLTMCPNNTAHLFAIGFLGLPGSGKSTLADILSNELKLPVNRSDQIRRFLNAKGFPGASPRQDIMAAMAERRTQFFYTNKTSAIIDSNFTEYAANSRVNASKHGATLLLVRVICPDEVALQRLRLRSGNVNTGDSSVEEADYKGIKARVATFPPVNDPYFEIDTTLPLEPQVKNLHETLVRDGYL
jgi:predicted kinase